MIQKQLFRLLQLFNPEVKYFYQKKTLETIRKSYSFRENELKHEINFGKEFASEGVEAAYIARTIVFIHRYLKCCV